MLPFLKNRDDGVGVGPVETKEREPDGFEMLDAIAEDILRAVEKKDSGVLKGALEALVAHIQDQDAEQDQEMAE